jgi:hypothetical protein
LCVLFLLTNVLCVLFLLTIVLCVLFLLTIVLCVLFLLTIVLCVLFLLTIVLCVLRFTASDLSLWYRQTFLSNNKFNTLMIYFNILNHGILVVKLKSSHWTFYSRHYLFVNRYGYLCNKIPRTYSVSRNHNPVLSSFGFATIATWRVPLGEHILLTRAGSWFHLQFTVVFVLLEFLCRSFVCAFVVFIGVIV